MAIQNIGKSVSSIVGTKSYAWTDAVGPQLFQAAADTLSALNTQVSIAGIPIFSETVNCNRNVDVSAIMLADATTGNKEFVTDNTAPQPRVWSITGYIKNLIPVLESIIVIKPTLMLQRFLLDKYAKGRNTVQFRDEIGGVYDVVIRSFDYTYDSKGTNAYAVRLVLQEAVTIRNVNARYIDLTDATSEAVAASIPSQVVTSLPGRTMTQLIGTTLDTSFFIGSLVLQGALDAWKGENTVIDWKTGKLVPKKEDPVNAELGQAEYQQLHISSDYTLSKMNSFIPDANDFVTSARIGNVSYMITGHYEDDPYIYDKPQWIFSFTNLATETEKSFTLHSNCKYELENKISFICVNETSEEDITFDNLGKMQFIIMEEA